MSLELESRIINYSLSASQVPVVKWHEYLKDALDMMNQKCLGIVCVQNDQNQIVGVFTDGDLRRNIINMKKPLSAFMSDNIMDHASSSFASLEVVSIVQDAVRIFKEKEIWDIPILDDDKKLVGLFHIKGIFLN